MKKTFEKLPQPKRQHIIDSCIKVFGAHGYDKSTTDQIIKEAGISKGALYEYTGSKGELFVFIIGYVYDKLYGYIEQELKREYPKGISDILDRVRKVSSIAVDFYIDYPEYIKVIEKAGRITDTGLADRSMEIFNRHYNGIFADFDSSRLRIDADKLLKLIISFLIQTRRTFLDRLDTQSDISAIKYDYLQTWEFYLDILQKGVYKEG